MKTTLNSPPVIVKTVSVEDNFDVNYYSNGIAEIVWSKNLKIVEICHIKKIQLILKEFGNGEKIPVFLTTRTFLNLSKEANEFSAKKVNSMYTKAYAVLIDELSKRILFNFYLTIFKPEVIYKGFPNKEEAFTWLLSLK